MDYKCREMAGEEATNVHIMRSAATATVPSILVPEFVVIITSTMTLGAVKERLKNGRRVLKIAFVRVEDAADFAAS